MIKDGIFLVNKTYNRSSTTEVRVLRKLLNQRKVGHTGTLDLLATGLLVVCVGSATKTIEYLQQKDKEYQVGIQFGIEKDSIDNEGSITGTTDVKIKRSQLSDVLGEFVGEIEQIPPMHSAIRHNGKRLYELARKGIEIDIKPRRVTIDSLELLDFDYEKQYATLNAVVGSGTYIRSLVRDIALRVGTLGYMDKLVRTRCSGYSIDQSIQINFNTPIEVIQNNFIPIDEILTDLPMFRVDSNEAKHLKNGMTLVSPVPLKLEKYRIFDGKTLLGYSDIKRSDKGTLIKLEKHLYI